MFGLGSGLYFALPREPVVAVGFAGLGIGLCGLGVIRTRIESRAMSAALVLLVCLGLGFSVARLRTLQVQAPIAPAGNEVRRIEAYVVDIVSPGQGGPRLLLAPVFISGLDPDLTPIRARITLPKDSLLPAPGSMIRLQAMLNPPPPPASPGAFDFARDAFFEGVGGVGFTLTPWTEMEAPSAPGNLGVQVWINRLRWALALRVFEVTGPSAGGLAAAMITGHEVFIPPEQVDRLRAAGLAHIISISGLHMAIVGGFAFGLVRVLVACWPALALRASSRKLAALAGLVAVGTYLLISGSPAPAERAAITAFVAFGAILVDRRAISLRTLSIAALLILIRQPEAVTEPGFQMSFAATTALVALAEAWPRPVKDINLPWPVRGLQSARDWLGGSLAASFVAGLATGPIAMQHFNRVSTYGLIANLLVAPISSFLMMPALALGAILAPLGLGSLPLGMAGLAIELMDRVAGWAESLPGSQLIIASGPGWTLPVAMIGIFWLCLWRGPLRWLGLPLALAVSLTPRGPMPDIWVASDGATLAVRRGKEAILLRPEVKRFGAELWARRRGLILPQDEVEERDRDFDCDRWTCLPKAGASPSVAAVFTRRGSILERDRPLACERAEIVILRGEGPPCASALTLTGKDFQQGGAAELYRTDSGWRIVWTQSGRGERPWSLSDTGE
jgi:competence protein ComEC